MGQRVGDVGDQRAGLCVDLAALQAEPAVDAVRPVAEAAVGDGDRPHPHRCRAPRRRAARSTRCRPPGGGCAGSGAGRPTASPAPPRAARPRSAGSRAAGRRSSIGQSAPDPVGAAGVEVRRVKPRHVARVMHHRPADAAPGVVGAQRHRVGAADLAGVGPEQHVRSAFVADPVGVGIPERAGVQPTTRPPGPGQPLRQRPPPAPPPTMTTSTSSSSAYRRMSARSWWFTREPSLGISQADSLRARTRGASSRALPGRRRLAGPLDPSANGTGSASSWSATSHFSRALTPGLRYPRG